MQSETAVFGGGCFWCTEAIFKSLRGVISVVPGYAGGRLKNPSYYDVCTGATGHAEVIKLVFDPSVITYNDLLEVFWNTHNPTSLNQQGNDLGTPYRSIILYTSKKQKETIEKSLQELRKSKQFDNPIVTEVRPLDSFYEAEQYHKDYYARNTDEPYCQYIISPKLMHLREKFASKLK